MNRNLHIPAKLVRNESVKWSISKLQFWKVKWTDLRGSCSVSVLVKTVSHVFHCFLTPSKCKDLCQENTSEKLRNTSDAFQVYKYDHTLRKRKNSYSPELRLMVTSKGKQRRFLLPHGFLLAFPSLCRSCCSEGMGVALAGSVTPPAGWQNLGRAVHSFSIPLTGHAFKMDTPIDCSLRQN